MKCLTLFIHAAVESEVVDCLRGNDDVSGFTLTRCQGHSRSTEQDPFLATRDRVVGFVPRVRIEIVLEDSDVEPTMSRLKSCLSSRGAVGLWIVTDVVDSGRL